MYIARQLSFSGVTFSIEDVGLSKDFIQVYDKAVEFVSNLDNRKFIVILSYLTSGCWLRSCFVKQLI